MAEIGDVLCIGPGKAHLGHFDPSYSAVKPLKLVSIRGEDAISATPGGWGYLTLSLRSALNKASGRFALEPPTSNSMGMHSRSASVSPPEQLPTASDYAFWSIAELVLLHRTPLVIHLRTIIREKVADCPNFSYVGSFQK